MQGEKETDRLCSTCLYYDVYYVRFGDSFARLNYGFCAWSHEQLQAEGDTCKKWSPRQTDARVSKSF